MKTPYDNEQITRALELATDLRSVDLGAICNSIARVKGFYDFTLGDDFAFAYRSLVHIAAELNEAIPALEAKALDEAAVEFADVIILVADMIGQLYDENVSPITLEDVRYTHERTLYTNLYTCYSWMCQVAYKWGFGIMFYTLAQIFVNSVAYYGVYCAGGTEQFRDVILEKCRKNLSRPHRFGISK